MRVRTRVGLAAGGALVMVLAGVAASTETVFRAESESMAPAIGVGDIVVAGRAAAADVGRSDMIVFTDPGGWAETAARLTGADAVSPTFIKRVVGLPGEHVQCCDARGRVTVDDVALAEPYLADPASLASVLSFDVEVPDGAVFVLGDNRAASIDSRYLGVVPISSVVAVEQFTIPLP